MVQKVSGQPGKFPDSLESFRIVWKVSGQSGYFPDGLESFRIAWKVSGQSEYFPDGPESFDNPEKILIMPKVTRQSSFILDGETISHVFFQCFQNGCHHKMVMKLQNQGSVSFETEVSQQRVWPVNLLGHYKNSTYYFDLDIELQFYVHFLSRKLFMHNFLSQIQSTHTFLLQK